MCSTAYDLVCEKCRRKFDRIFSVKIESAEQERKLLTKWLKSLCKNCRQILMEEGFIAEE
jgi:hypothetical protein